MAERIEINGIRTHNLKDINIKLEKKAINLIIGPSGSGKSSLAYDTIAQIGQHEFLSMFADDISEPTYKIKSFQNMVVAVPIKQSNHNNNLHSTIGTYFGLNRIIATIYADCLGLPEEIFVLNKESNLCANCHGIGTVSELDEIRIVNYGVPVGKNPFRCWNRYKDFYEQIINEYCLDSNIDPNKTFRDLTENEKRELLYGESIKKYSIRYKKNNAFSRRTTKYFGVMTGHPLLVNHSIGKQFYSEKKCTCCHGKKYSDSLEQFKLYGLSIGDFMIMPFKEVIVYLNRIIKGLKDERLTFKLTILKKFIEKAIDLNLGHLFFHRSIPTLSGGELQRLRMIQVFNTQLSGLLIVLDEPLAGLSGQEKNNVFKNVIGLSKNHTVVVVDHSEKFINVAKTIVTLGKEGGNKGGYIVDTKEYLEIQKRTGSLAIPCTGKTISVIVNNVVYQYTGANIEIMEKCMNLITGYSGVGKSTLLREYFPQFFDNYAYINQKPLLGNKNSSVATLLDISSNISELYAKKFKKDKKFFSNLTGNDGMCKACQGAGYIEYGNDRNMLTHLECKECEGTGFNKELRKYKIDEKDIFDIWGMTINEAIIFFEKHDKKIVKALEQAKGLLLGHLKIGQPTITLSGGENIRIKILKATKTTSNILGIDEPFKGLSQQEIFKMVKYLDGLRKAGKTIVVIDHTDNVERFFSKHIVLKNDKSVLVGT